MIRSLAFRHGDFRRLWLGATCNSIGMNGEQVVISLLVYQITGSTAWVGVVLALNFVPYAVFGGLSGAVADWMDRRILLRRVELCIAANLLLFAALMGAGFADRWTILAFTLISGSLRALHQPVRASYAYDIVGGEHVVSGIGLLNLGSRVGQLAGALVAGFATERLGAPAALLSLAFLHGGAYGLFAHLRTQGLATTIARVPMGQNLREFLAEARSNRVLLMLVVVTASVEVFGFSFATALPELATQRLAMGAEGLGLLHAARAVGGIAATLLLSVLNPARGRGNVYIGVIGAFGVSLLMLSAAGSLWAALSALFFVSGMAAASDVLTQSMMQVSVPNHLRGRAMGAWVFAIGSAPLGHLEMGALATVLGLGPALFANGLGLIAIGLFAVVAVPRLRRL